MTNMYGSEGNASDASPDSLLHLGGLVVECQETTADMNAEEGSFNASLSDPDSLPSGLLSQVIQILDNYPSQESSLPETPSEPYGQLRNNPSCLLEDSEVFIFPPSASFSSLPLQQMSPTSSGFGDFTLMDTPPTTPTDPECLNVQQIACMQAQQFPPQNLAQTSCGPQPQLLCQPPRRQRNVSYAEGDDTQGDINIPTDIVLYNKGLTTSKENDNLDPRLKEALQRSQGSQSLVPLLKEELRLKIMKKRLDSGQEELKIDFTQSPSYQMTEEDEIRRKIRRDQNRGAAHRFRQRKKQKETEMRKKMEENKKKNERLRREVDFLSREVARLQQLLLQHRHCNDCRLLPSLVSVIPTTTSATD